jgi:hypothetical protein
MHEAARIAVEKVSGGSDGAAPLRGEEPGAEKPPTERLSGADEVLEG